MLHMAKPADAVKVFFCIQIKKIIWYNIKYKTNKVVKLTGQYQNIEGGENKYHIKLFKQNNRQECSGIHLKVAFVHCEIFMEMKK